AGGAGDDDAVRATLDLEFDELCVGVVVDRAVLLERGHERGERALQLLIGEFDHRCSPASGNPPTRTASRLRATAVRPPHEGEVKVEPFPHKSLIMRQDSSLQ